MFGQGIRNANFGKYCLEMSQVMLEVMLHLFSIYTRDKLSESYDTEWTSTKVGEK